MEFRTEAKELGRFDVVVVGGGPAGVGAAVAAARRGAKTLLVESQGCLGEVATSAGVGLFGGHMKREEPNEPCVGGIFRTTPA